jgi:acyl homoserine lactone synthase
MAGLYAVSDEERREQGLFTSYLELRRRIFTKAKGWAVDFGDTSDDDRYDQLDALYVVAHKEGDVLGGARLLCTDRAPVANGTYMLLDAFHGKLNGLPNDLCEVEPPKSSKSWELTRLLAPNHRGVAQAILQKADKYLASKDANECLFLGRPAFIGMAKRMGYNPHPLGPVSGNHDGKFLAFKTQILGVG